MYPPYASSGINASHISTSAGTVISAAADQGFTFYFQNYTDGDIQIDYLYVMFIKLT